MCSVCKNHQKSATNTVFHFAHKRRRIVDLSPHLHKQGGRQRDYDLEHGAHKWSFPVSQTSWQDKSQRCQVPSIQIWQIYFIFHDLHDLGDLGDLRDRSPGVGSKPLAQSFHSARFWFVQCHPQRWFGASLLHRLIVLLPIKAWYKKRKSKIGEWEPPICQRRLQEMMHLCEFRLPKKHLVCGKSDSLSACRHKNWDSLLNLFDLGVPSAVPNRSCIKADYALILPPRYKKYKYENFPIALCTVYQSIRCFFSKGSYGHTCVDKPLLVALPTWSKTIQNVLYSACTDED